MASDNTIAIYIYMVNSVYLKSILALLDFFFFKTLQIIHEMKATRMALQIMPWFWNGLWNSRISQKKGKAMENLDFMQQGLANFMRLGEMKSGIKEI